MRKYRHHTGAQYLGSEGYKLALRIDPVQYIDEVTGDWKDIATILIDRTSHWVLSGSYYSLKVPKRSTGEFEVLHDGGGFGFTPKSVNDVVGILGGDDRSVVYANAYGTGNDLVLRVGNKFVEKLVVINTMPGRDLVFDFELTHRNIPDLELSEVDSSRIIQSGDNYLRMDPVKCYDSNDQQFPVTGKIVLEDGKHILRKTLRKNDLTDAVFPIRTDAIISLSAAVDGYVYYTHPTINYEMITDQAIKTENFTNTTAVFGREYSIGTYKAYWGVLIFDTSAIPSDKDHRATLSQVRLNITIQQILGGAFTYVLGTYVPLLNGQWFAGIDADRLQSCSRLGSGPIASTGSYWLSMQSLDFLDSIAKTGWAHFGVTDANIARRAQYIGDARAVFYTSEWSNPAQRPVLEVTYEIPTRQNALNLDLFGV